MSDEKYLQRAPGGPLKAGTWVYNKEGRLVSVDGVPVPPEVEVYSQEVIDSLPPKEEKEGDE